MINSNKYENPSAQNNSISVRDGLTLLLVGGGIGAALAILFAPKSGREMRHDIADVTRRGYDLTVEKASELKAQSAEKLQLVKDKAGAAYEFAATKLHQSGEAINDAAETASEAVVNGLDEIARENTPRVKHASLGRKSASIF